MKELNKDYTNMTAIAARLGLVPYNGILNIGLYSYKGLNAPVDLSACAENEISILKTSVSQLSEHIE